MPTSDNETINDSEASEERGLDELRNRETDHIPYSPVRFVDARNSKQRVSELVGN